MVSYIYHSDFMTFHQRARQLWIDYKRETGEANTPYPRSNVVLQALTERLHQERARQAEAAAPQRPQPAPRRQKPAARPVAAPRKLRGASMQPRDRPVPAPRTSLPPVEKHEDWDWSRSQSILDEPKPKEVKSLISFPKGGIKLANPPPYEVYEDVGILRRFTARLPLSHKLERDVLSFLTVMHEYSARVLKSELIRLGPIKMYQSLTVDYEKPGKDGEIIATSFHTSRAVPILNEGDIQPALAQATAKMNADHEKFMREGSGWTIKRCVKLDLSTAQYRPLRARGHFKTPNYIPPRTVVNVENKDNRCFEWAILSALYPVAENAQGRSINAQRMSKYKAHLGKLNFDGISFPVQVTDIAKFERLNSTIAVNLFGWDDGPYPIYNTCELERLYTINLLMLVDGTNQHYVWIKDIAKLCYRNSNYEHRKHPCVRCLHVFSRMDLLQKHEGDCMGIGEKPQRTIMPEEGKNILKFEGYHKQMRVPYIIYADFECLNISVEGCANDPRESSTRQVSEQTPCGYCYVVIRCDGVTKPPVVYRGESVVEHFLASLQDELIEINEVFKHPAMMDMSPDDWRSFDSAKDCHICDEPLAGDMVRDHCHITGKFRGAAHKECNLKLQIHASTYIGKDDKEHKRRGTPVPVVFHNLRGYDGHLIMSALGECGAAMDEKISCIPNNIEKYMSFSIGQLRFIDSLQFLNTSLDKLAANNSELWSTSCKSCARTAEIKDGVLRRDRVNVISSGLCGHCKMPISKHTSSEVLADRFPYVTSQEPIEQTHLLLRKGVYPYEYVDSVDRFTETQLPPIEAFYSSLTRENIGKSDYEHAQIVWNSFSCRTLGDYHDLYLKTDVLLLADVFEKFRNISLQHYGLDPAHYFSAPGMSWDALLKKTKAKLELLTDIDMHLFMEKGLRGGVCMVSKRFSKANNPQCPDYDDSKPIKWIAYTDANNLYGWAMSQSLPTGGFQWLDCGSVTMLDEVLTTPDDAPEGYLLEVDLEYLEHLHDIHNDYPLAPETIAVPEEWLSDYQHTLVNELGGKYTECSKLVPNLQKKERYIIHYRNLKLYHSLGMRVSKVHRAIKFRQEAWMAPYIQLNTELRTQASSEFEKEFFKLMNNSVFGKTMENLRQHIKVDLVRSSENDKLRRLIADPAFKTFREFSGGLYAIHSTKSSIKLNRPVYVGMAVLDQSKLRMGDFWYNTIKARYGNKAQLCYTDTDSLLYEVETDDIYSDMRDDSGEYDFSDYPKDHPNHSVINKKVPGKFKDECCGRPIAEFVGLRPKMYSIQTMGLREDSGWVPYPDENKSELRKAKGVQRTVVKKDLRHELYKQCLNERVEMRHKQIVIRSKKHQMGVYEQVKISLSPLDTKRWISPDGITSKAYGHYRIEQEAVDDFMDA